MNNALTFAQFTDSHLFAERHQLHCGAPVFQHLIDVLTAIDNRDDIAFLIFTGDLTQDHTALSYQRFVEACHIANKQKRPIYYVPGNHDDLALLTQIFNNDVLRADRVLDIGSWQIQLLNSKSETPAGTWHYAEQTRCVEAMAMDKHQLLVMHHHPVDVNSFIDRHGLQNKADFYQFVSSLPKVKAVLSGHVHNEYVQQIPQTQAKLYTCPATSLQFDPLADTVADAGLGPGYRTVTLFENGTLDTEVIFLNQ